MMTQTQPRSRSRQDRARPAAGCFAFIIVAVVLAACTQENQRRAQLQTACGKATCECIFNNAFYTEKKSPVIYRNGKGYCREGYELVYVSNQPPKKPGKPGYLPGGIRATIGEE